jgi:hypothetical protein
MILKHFIAILLSFSFFSVFAQSNGLIEKSDNHEHHKNEIAIANSPVYFPKDKEVEYGLHFHYVRNISDTKFGLGLGYEKIFGNHKHDTFGIVGCYSPIDNLVLNVSPGLTFENGSKTPILSLHLETSYEFEYKDFHIGPAFECAFDSEDTHISLGLHLGYGF